MMAEDASPSSATLWGQAFQTWLEGWQANVGLQPASDAPAADPFQLWRRSFDRWLAGWTVALDQSLGTPEAAAASGRVLDAALNVEKPAREQMAAFMAMLLQFMNLPSREDVVRLAVQVNEANARLDEVRDLIEDVADQVSRLAGAAANAMPNATTAQS